MARWIDGVCGLGLTALAALLVAACDDAATCGEGANCAGAGGTGSSSGTKATSSGSGQMSTKASSGASQPTSTSGGDKCAGGPLAAPIANCKPTPVPDSGDAHQDCVDRINQFRWECQCLPPLERWTDGESCTDDQSKDDQDANQAHSHFPACGENAQNTCPNWNDEGHVIEGCLQMMWDEGPGDFNQGHGHYLNMSSTQYKKVACGFSNGQAGTWSNQNFAP